tara:strand:- start:743 stop:1774 length:1032 start_codon:yes stop_codon:yes gene_type:complete
MISSGSAAFDLKQFLRTTYWFGSTTHGVMGPMTFAPSGYVIGRSHPSEYRYKISPQGDLSFISRQNEVTSVVRYVPEIGQFVPQQGYPHFLIPILTLDPDAKTASRPSVFVNTVPKSGTYLLARALEIAGFVNQRLHVMDEFFHDNRGIDDDAIHWDPQCRQVNCSAAAVASLLRGGEYVVGHCDQPTTLTNLAKTDVIVVNLIREPRDMLASMFTFKQAKVKPQPSDRLWQSLDGIAAFKAFLLCHPVQQWIAQTYLLAEQPHVLRFEDIRAGRVDRKAIGFRFSRELEKSLKNAIGQKTATYVPGDRSAIRAYMDDPDIMNYLTDTGVMALSHRFWPEIHV